jgi:hypothetical protein
MTTYTFVNKSKLKRLALKISLGFIFASVLVFSGFYGLYTVSAYFDSNKLNFRSPVIIQTPVTVEKRTTLHVNFAPFQIAKAQELTEAIKWTDRGLSPIGLSDIEKEICEAFEKHCKNAIRIAQCESGMDTQKIGDLGISYKEKGTQYGLSFGVFQIRYLPGRPKPSELLKPEVNISFASKLFHSMGDKFGSLAGWYNCSLKLGIK